MNDKSTMRKNRYKLARKISFRVSIKSIKTVSSDDKVKKIEKTWDFNFYPKSRNNPSFANRKKEKKKEKTRNKSWIYSYFADLGVE